jgi:hypothetical protein
VAGPGLGGLAALLVLLRVLLRVLDHPLDVWSHMNHEAQIA